MNLEQQFQDLRRRCRVARNKGLTIIARDLDTTSRKTYQRAVSLGQGWTTFPR